MILCRSILALRRFLPQLRFCSKRCGSPQAPILPRRDRRSSNSKRRRYAAGPGSGQADRVVRHRLSDRQRIPQERKLDIDMNTVIKALQDGFAKRPSTLTDEQMRDLLSARAVSAVFSGQSANSCQDVATENKAKSVLLLAADNKAKKGIIALPSGMQYRIIEDCGTGTRYPTAQKEVTVHHQEIAFQRPGIRQFSSRAANR